MQCESGGKGKTVELWGNAKSFILHDFVKTGGYVIIAGDPGVNKQVINTSSGESGGPDERKDPLNKATICMHRFLSPNNVPLLVKPAHLCTFESGL